MDENERLNLLRQQKKEIEKQIYDLSHKTIESEEARIGVEHYSTGKLDRWYLAINVQFIGYPHSSIHASKYRTVVNATTKQDVIDAIPYIIKDLQELYDKAVKG